jgi:hypothetical protein
MKNYSNKEVTSHTAAVPAFWRLKWENDLSPEFGTNLYKIVRPHLKTKTNK